MSSDEPEETTSEEVEDTDEEETSGEEEDGSKDDDTSPDEEPEEKPKERAPPAKSTTKTTSGGGKAKPSSGGEKKKTVSSKSHVAEGRAKTEVKKTFFGSSDVLVFECDMASGAVAAGSNIDVHVCIKNDSPKTVKSIDAWLRVFKGKPKGKGKKVKRPKPKKVDGTEQEFFQGARFPLPSHVGYDGNISFPLPKKLEATSETVEYEIVLQFDVSATLGWNHVQAFLPVVIKG